MRNAVRFVALAINVMLLLWLLFYNALEVPVWLQVAGRLHPVLLHFPLVLWLIWAIWLWGGKNWMPEISQRQRIDGTLLAAAVLFTGFTALLGMLLSREAGYEGDLMNLHLYAGTALAVGGMFLLFFPVLYRANRRVAGLGVIFPVLLVFFAGHTGASLTHGSDFITGPLQQKTDLPNIAFAEALVYEHGVLPVLEAKCMQCHKEGKQKGELLMTTQAGLLAGGKSGALWDTANPAASLMLQRIHLPLEEEEHMPPKGKLQLTDDDKMLLDSWIAAGASFSLRFAQLPQDHQLYAWAQSRFGAEKGAALAYTYPAYDESLLKELSNEHCVIYPVAQGTQALAVQFYGSAGFSARSLEALQPLRQQIAQLNLSRMPLTDDMLKEVARMEGLQVLHLNHTPVTASGLKHLVQLPHLQKLSLNATNIDAAAAKVLFPMPALQVVYAGNSGISPADVALLQKEKPALNWVIGPQLSNMVLPLNPPIIDHVEKVFTKSLKLKIRHPIQGVRLHYTLDGSEPDSILSPVYSDTMKLYSSAVFKIRAFKPGWIGSTSSEAGFFRRMHKADNVILAQPPHPNYAAEGAATLQDGQLSDKNFKSGLWAGFKDGPMDATFQFKQPVQVSSLSLSTVVDIGSYIMPAQKVEVWGQTAGSKSWQVLNSIQPTQPQEVIPIYLSALQVPVPPGAYAALRIVVHPVSKLPAWHQGRGDKGWFFTDEVFIN